jgi:phosphoribosylaminoimidazole-succinocarboxamide synthase
MATTSAKYEKIIIEGCPYSGKTTLINKLKISLPNVPIVESVNFQSQYKKHWELWKKLFNNKSLVTCVICLEADPLILSKRSNQKLSESDCFLLRYRYRQLAAFNGNVHLINTSNITVEELVKIVNDVYTNNNNEHLIPCIDEITQEQFESFPKVIQGESKIIRQFNKRFQIIKYIASVHSHKEQRSGIVEGTDIERMKMTKNILDLFSRYQIKHSYFYIGTKYILNESLNPEKDLPPVEVIVKKCFVGSDKVRYFNMENLKNRFGKEVIQKDNNYEYQKYLVRFDYRNPNYHPETKKPLGDLPLCDDLADEYINVDVAKKTAKFIFGVLDEHFKKMNMYFEDVCFMLTVEGDVMYGEVSQDCGRYKYIEEDKLTDLDKDVWRKWGSFEMVLTKYQMMGNIVEKYIKDVFYKEE